MSMMDQIRIGAAELIGTGFLVLVGCMGCMSTMAPGGIPHAQISFTFGFAVMFAIQIFGHISGAHLNPAVTVAAVVLGYTPYLLAPVYAVAQVIGAVLGFALLKAVTPGKFFDAKEHFNAITNQTVRDYGVCSTIPNAEISSLQALAVEILITLVLILVCAGVWDHRNAKNTDSIPIRFGLTIAGLAMAGGPYTGASMNPARSFGPALLNGDWTQHWVYWLGPLLAAVVGAGGYKALFAKPAPQTDSIELEDIPLNTTNHEKA